LRKLESPFLTTGQLAQRTGITIRTLRYYDKIGLLKPAKHNNASTRLYNKDDMARLQKIQMLKFIGLSLSEISQIMFNETQPERDLRSSLKLQKDIIQHKIAHMLDISKTIDEAMAMIDDQGEELDWKGLAGIIQSIHTENNGVSNTLMPFACRLESGFMISLVGTKSDGIGGSLSILALFPV